MENEKLNVTLYSSRMLNLRKEESMKKDHDAGVKYERNAMLAQGIAIWALGLPNEKAALDAFLSQKDNEGKRLFARQYTKVIKDCAAAVRAGTVVFTEGKGKTAKSWEVSISDFQAIYSGEAYSLNASMRAMHKAVAAVETVTEQSEEEKAVYAFAEKQGIDAIQVEDLLSNPEREEERRNAVTQGNLILAEQAKKQLEEDERFMEDQILENFRKLPKSAQARIVDAIAPAQNRHIQETAVA